MAWLSGVANVVLAVVSIIVYGYCEKITGIQGTGAVVSSILLGLYLFKSRGGMQIVLSPILVALQLYIVSPWAKIPFNLQKSQASLSVFSLLIANIFMGSGVNNVIDSPKRQPYEKEIRSILMQYDPSQLSKVDNMLSQNKGYEDKLINSLREKYNIEKEDYSYNDEVSSPIKNEIRRDKEKTDLFRVELIKLCEKYEPRLLKSIEHMMVSNTDTGTDT
jgi:hypothetical protein